MNNRLRPPLREPERRREDFDRKGITVRLGDGQAWVMRVPRAVLIVRDRPGAMPEPGFCFGATVTNDDGIFGMLWRGYEQSDPPDCDIARELAVLTLHFNYILSGPEIHTLLGDEVVASADFQTSIRKLANEAGSRVLAMVGPKLPAKGNLYGDSTAGRN